MIFFILGCIASKITDSGLGDVQEEAPPYATVQSAQSHLDAFHQIAIDHGGNRTTGSSGYQASVEYVSEQLTLSGYSVDIQEFFVPTYRVNSPPQVTLEEEVLDETVFVPLTYSPSGEGEGMIVPVDLQIPPGNPNSSTSGCQSSDFEGFNQV